MIGIKIKKCSYNLRRIFQINFSSTIILFRFIFRIDSISIKKEEQKRKEPTIN